MIISKSTLRHISIIYINSVANKLLFAHVEESKHIELFTKRKLFSHSDFQQFMLNEIKRNQEQETTIAKVFETIVLQQVNLLYSKIELDNKIVREYEISEFSTKFI